MCGRYGLADVFELRERFGLAHPLTFVTPRFNVMPSQMMPVIIGGEPPHLELMQWGFIPSWSKDGKGFINARAETVAERPAFRQALRFQRCLVPAGGFYEWRQTPRGKVPHYIHLKDARLFSFAGIYSTWTNPQGEEVRTYAIITTEANELMAPIHNRMPVILRREDEATWLNPAETDPGPLLDLLRPYVADEMEAYPVSRAVNDPANDGPDLLEGLSEPS